MAAETTDQQLVQNALRNPDAFLYIVKKYEIPLKRYITRLGCRNTDDTADVLQDIFLKIYINLNEYEAQLKFSSWVYRIAHNETISFFRKKGARPTLIESEEELRLFDALVDDIDTPLIIDAAETKMTSQNVRETLSLLPAEYRDVLVLQYLEERSYDEISDILKIPLGTVGTLISRGKKKLRDICIAKNLHV